jgi:O-antigen/teichoic acid export membrane protein
MKKNISIQVKSSIVAFLSTFITGAISFLTMPIFTRILSIKEYGIVSTYNAWEGILFLIVSLCLYSSINKAYLDFQDEIAPFLSSISFLTLILVIIGSVLINIFLPMFDSLKLNRSVFILMGMQIWAQSIQNIFIIKERFHYRYKIPFLISIINIFSNVGLSLFLVFNLNKNVYMGRIIGSVLGSFIISCYLFYLLINDGKTFINIKYWKYALSYGVPILFHSIGLRILSQSDRIMIGSLIGTEAVALYSIPYQICTIITILWSSILVSYNPWLYRKLNAKDYKDIHEKSKYIILLGVFLVISIIAFSPILLKLLAPDTYSNGLIFMPPIAFALMFQCIYTTYCTVENFYRKSKYIAYISIFVAVLNIILNYYFINIYGYVAAAYTTLFCYILLALLHGLFVTYLDKNALPSTYYIKASIICLILGLLIIKFYGSGYNYLLMYASIISILTILYNKKLLLLIKNGI